MKKHTECGEKHLPSVCIDLRAGIFMVALRKSGLLAPIHVQSHKKNQIQFCTNDSCQSMMTNPNLENPAIECLHLRSVATALKADMVLLQEKFLQDLVTMKLISEHTKKRCLEVQKTCLQQNTPLVVHANFSTLGYKDRMMYFSVYSGVVKYYSKLLRVRVTFDSGIGVWSCKCPLSGERSSCVHEVMSKWYLFQKDKDRMLSSQSR